MKKTGYITFLVVGKYRSAFIYMKGSSWHSVLSTSGSPIPQWQTLLWSGPNVMMGRSAASSWSVAWRGSPHLRSRESSPWEPRQLAWSSWTRWRFQKRTCCLTPAALGWVEWNHQCCRWYFNNNNCTPLLSYIHNIHMWHTNLFNCTYYAAWLCGSFTVKAHQILHDMQQYLAITLLLLPPGSFWLLKQRSVWYCVGCSGCRGILFPCSSTVHTRQVCVMCVW